MILALDETKVDINSLTALIDTIPTSEQKLAAERAKEDNEIQNFGICVEFLKSLQDVNNDCLCYSLKVNLIE